MVDVVDESLEVEWSEVKGRKEKEEERVCGWWCRDLVHHYMIPSLSEKMLYSCKLSGRLPCVGILIVPRN